MEIPTKLTQNKFLFRNYFSCFKEYEYLIEVVGISWWWSEKLVAGRGCLWVKIKKRRRVVVGPTLVGEDKEERDTKMTFLPSCASHMRGV